MRNTSHEIRIRDVETDKKSRELTQNSTKSHGKGYVRDNTKGQEKIHIDQRKTKIKDIIQVVKQLKWRWAGHVARMNDNRWTKRLTDWHPYNEKRSRKRPDTRQKDEIEKFAGVAWQNPSLSNGLTMAAADDDNDDNIQLE